MILELKGGIRKQQAQIGFVVETNKTNLQKKEDWKKRLWQKAKIKGRLLPTPG